MSASSSVISYEMPDLEQVFFWEWYDTGTDREDDLYYYIIDTW